jgi:CPA2 family monovalent cation:H+ antiporter-2
VGDELVALGGAFLIAGLLARVGRRFGLPTIPIFMVAGILVGPHTPGFVLVDDPAELELLAALGLILLLFHLGLEFSLSDLVGGGRRILFWGVAHVCITMAGGLALGFAVGWGSAEALVIAGAVGISSSAIVTKLLIELRRLADPESRMILGIIVVEDLFLALYLALLQPVLGDAEGAGDAAFQFARALVFLVTLGLVARYGARFVARILDDPEDELLTILFLGLAILVAGFAEELGVSDAIGAFAVGLILAESAVAERVGRLVLPLRDAFAAIFFFAFGLTIDPADTELVLVPVTIAVVLTLVLNVVAGVLVARANGYDRRGAANVSFTLVGRGEFSLILATLAMAAGLDARLGPFVALYVLVLAILGPLMTAKSSVLARAIPERFLTRNA